MGIPGMEGGSSLPQRYIVLVAGWRDPMDPQLQQFGVLGSSMASGMLQSSHPLLCISWDVSSPMGHLLPVMWCSGVGSARAFPSPCFGCWVPLAHPYGYLVPAWCTSGWQQLPGAASG